MYALGSDADWVDAGTSLTYLAANLVYARDAWPFVLHRLRGRGQRKLSGRLGKGRTGGVVSRSLLLDGARVGGRRGDNGFDRGSRRGGGRGSEALRAVGHGGRIHRRTGGRAERGASPTSIVRALVTGGAGFIGSTLVDRLLAEGHDVAVVDDLSTGTLANLASARRQSEGHLTFHQVDIRSPDLVEVVGRCSPDVVYHLAAQIDVRRSVVDPLFDAEVNIIGSLQVIEASRRAGTRKVVFASSGGTIYGNPAPEDLPVKESHSQLPLSPYGVSKKVVGDYLHAYRALHDLEFSALALANVYGPRKTPTARPEWWRSSCPAARLAAMHRVRRRYPDS